MPLILPEQIEQGDHRQQGCGRRADPAEHQQQRGHERRAVPMPLIPALKAPRHPVEQDIVANRDDGEAQAVDAVAFGGEKPCEQRRRGEAQGAGNHLARDVCGSIPQAHGLDARPVAVRGPGARHLANRAAPAKGEGMVIGRQQDRN